MRIPSLALTISVMAPLDSLSDITVGVDANVLNEIQFDGLRGLEYRQTIPETMFENHDDNGTSIHEGVSEEVPIKMSTDFSLYNESLLMDLTRRRLQEVDWDASPENDIHNVQFSGYENSDPPVEQWMVEYLKTLNEIRMDEGVQNPLCFNELLLKSARKHIDDMLANETIMLSHTGSDGRNSGERITRDGYTWVHYGATIFAQTNCSSVECSISNRPMFFSENGKYNQFGVAREEQERAGGIRWYYIFATSDTDKCMGMDVTMLEWEAGTPTQTPTEEIFLPEPVDGDGSEFIEDWMIGMLSLINAERAHANKDPFCFNKKLMQAAHNHTVDMAQNDFVGHQGSDGDGPGHRAAEHGYTTYDFMAENIAYNTKGFREAMFAWMTSKSGHAYNIINPGGNHIGVATDTTVGLYTLVVADHHTESCIPSIDCESTVHTQDDPIFDRYACSLCFQRKGQMQFGVMGCGFGIEWYKTGDIEAKFELYMQINVVDGQMVNETNIQDFAASIQHPLEELLTRDIEGNSTVEIVSINNITVSRSRMLREDMWVSHRLLSGAVDVEAEITVHEECRFYTQCNDNDYQDFIKETVAQSVNDEISSGNLTEAIVEEAVRNNVTALIGATLPTTPITVVQDSRPVVNEHDHITHYPTSAPTSVPTTEPSSSPSDVPTVSLQPSSHPSSGPSSQPSVLPNYERCAGAISLNVGDIVTGSTKDSSSDPSADTCEGVSVMGGGVWYKVTGNGNRIRAKTCGPGTDDDFDTQISIYSGTCGSLSCVNANDDNCGYKSRVRWLSTVSTEYYILVHGYGGDTGDFELAIELAGTPNNDECADAIALSLNELMPSNTADATLDSTVEDCGARIMAPGIWYTVTGNGNTFRASTCFDGTIFDTQISVYVGSCFDMTCIGGNDDSCDLKAEFSWSTDVDNEYFILVHGYSGQSGAVELIVEDIGAGR